MTDRRTRIFREYRPADSATRLRVLGVLGMLAVADSAAAAAAEGKEYQEAEARALLRPWAHCAEVSQRAESHWLATGGFRARPTRNGVDVFFRSDGNGRWGLGYGEVVHLERGSCKAFGYAESGLKDYLAFELDRIGLGRAAPSLAEVAQLAGAQLAQPDAPAFAAARLYVQCAAHPAANCHEVQGDAAAGGLGAPLFAGQPEHAGRPRGSPWGFWSPADLARAQVKRSKPADADGDALDGVSAGPLRSPWLLTSRGRFELWEMRFRARNGGGLLAVYDKLRDRHRWVFVTEGDWQEPKFFAPGIHAYPQCSGHFNVIEFGDKRLLIATFFEDHDSLFAIDLQTGTARPVTGLPPRADFRAVAGGVEVRSWDWELDAAGEQKKRAAPPTLIRLPPP